MHEHADRDHTEPPTGEDAAALTALADALDTTPTELAAGPAYRERRRRYATALDLHSFAMASTYWQRLVLRAMDVADAELDEQAKTRASGHERQIIDLRRTLADERARTLAMAERHSEALHRATERAKTAEQALAIARRGGYDALNDKQRTELDRIEAEVKERWELHASDMHFHFDEPARHGHDRTVRVTWGDGERIAQATIDRHGNGGCWIADVDTLHNDFDDECECDHCKAYRDESCPHTCSCTSDQECPHDCPCDTPAGA